MRQTLKFLLFPCLVGLFAGLGIVIAKPDLRYAFGGYVINFFTPQKSSISSYALAVSQAAPAVVNISTRKTVQVARNPLFDDPLFRHFFNSADVPKQQRMSSALGSGVIINKEGYLLTNYHVIKDADEIHVYLFDGRNLEAKIIGEDPVTDLAVLKIPATEDMQAITLGEPHSALIGDVVLAIGNPFNIGQTVTQGIISATGRHGLGLSVYENFIQTDAAINPGNSGGALIDTEGRLLGINTAKVGNSNIAGSAVGIGFAIPADIAVNIMQDIITTGEAVRGWLGIRARGLTPKLAGNMDLSSLNGVLITDIFPEGPADLAGLKPGDVLTHINQQTVGNGSNVMNLIAQVRPEDLVQLSIIRSGIKELLTATAGKRPKQI